MHIPPNIWGMRTLFIHPSAVVNGPHLWKWLIDLPAAWCNVIYGRYNVLWAITFICFQHCIFVYTAHVDSPGDKNLGSTLIGHRSNTQDVGSIMMTSSNGNIFRITGPLGGEFISHLWIPLTKASDMELRWFLWCAWMNCWDTAEQPRHRWLEMPSCSLWYHCNVPNRHWFGGFSYLRNTAVFMHMHCWNFIDIPFYRCSHYNLYYPGYPQSALHSLSWGWAMGCLLELKFWSMLYHYHMFYLYALLCCPELCYYGNWLYEDKKFIYKS